MNGQFSHQKYSELSHQKMVDNGGFPSFFVCFSMLYQFTVSFPIKRMCFSILMFVSSEFSHYNPLFLWVISTISMGYFPFSELFPSFFAMFQLRLPVSPTSPPWRLAAATLQQLRGAPALRPDAASETMALTAGRRGDHGGPPGARGGHLKVVGFS